MLVIIAYRFFAVIIRKIVKYGFRNNDALRKIPDGLKAEHVGTVFDDLDFAGVYVDVAVFSLHEAVGKSRFQLEGAVGRFVTVSVRSVLIVSEMKS